MPTSDRRRALPSITLVVPAFAEAVLRSEIKMPALERLAAYSGRLVESRVDCSHENWQGEFFAALSISDMNRYPSAPLTLQGYGVNHDGGTWFHVDPIRMEMSVDGLSLRSAPRWNNEQLADLSQVFGTHFPRESIDFRVLGGTAFVRLPGNVEIETMSPRCALHRSLREALPRGLHADNVRRLMTEMQMLMHERFQGVDAANGVWLWGAGSGTTTTLEARELPQLWSNDSYANGVYLAHQASAHIKQLPKSFAGMADENEQTSIAVLRDLGVEALEFEWFEPALRALETRRIRAITVGADGWSFTATRSLWRRFLTRPRALADMMKQDDSTWSARENE